MYFTDIGAVPFYKTGSLFGLIVLPENAKRTDMGIIADTFRQRSDVITGEGIIRTSGYIGDCKYLFFAIRDVVYLYREELEKNPLKLYGLE